MGMKKQIYKAAFVAGFTVLLAGGMSVEANPATAITLAIIGTITAAIAGAMIHLEEVREELWG